MRELREGKARQCGQLLMKWADRTASTKKTRKSGFCSNRVTEVVTFR